jgi:hypothetical protein
MTNDDESTSLIAVDSQGKAVQSFAGASRRLFVVVSLQHIPARILAELALPQNAQTRKSHSHRHRGYREECELKLEA